MVLFYEIIFGEMNKRKCGKVDKVDIKYSHKVGEIWGIPIFSSGYGQVLEIIEEWLNNKQEKKWVATVNPEFVMKAREDKEFMAMLREKTALNVIDGVGLLWAMKIKKKKNRIREGLKVGLEIIRGKHRQQIASGSDLMEGLCQRAAKKGWTVFFLGGWGDRAERTARYFLSRYPLLRIKGTYSGMATGEDKKILEQIGKERVDILFVAYGMKRQEEWIDRNLKKLKVGMVMGVGRSFDYYSGDLKRAPMMLRKMGLEWLYSLVKEPKRWRRQMELPKFVARILLDSGKVT